MYIVLMKWKMIAVLTASHLIYSTITPPSPSTTSLTPPSQPSSHAPLTITLPHPHHTKYHHPTINPAITSPTAHLLMIVCPISVCVSISKVSCSRAWLRDEVLLKSVDRVMRLFVPTASILSMSSLVCTRNSLSPLVV